MTTRSDAADDRTPGTGDGTLFDRWVRTPLSALSFWSAIALPALYIPVLIGIDTTSSLVVFLGLFGLHVLALFGGRKHNVEDGN